MLDETRRLWLRISCCAAVVAALAPPAHAQGRLRFDAAGGVAFPVAPSAVTDAWGTGFVLSAAVRARAGARLVVGPEVGYARFAFDREAFETQIAPMFPNVNIGGNDLAIVSVLADAEYALVEWGNTRPFARAAAGYAHVSRTAGSASGPNAGNVVFPGPDDDAATIRIGGGMRTLLTPTMTLFVDACWQIVWVDPDPLQFVPVRVGLRF